MDDLFQAIEKDEKLELWKANSINKLMKYFKDNKNKKIIENGLINILFLADNFENFEYNNYIIKDFCDLNENEKLLSIELLKSEFIK
ncbi:MAG: hypothetical protein ACP6IY_04690 [Promethearchaeia archaeon]